MLKARRKEPSEQLKFPEPRDGLPEDPRVFMGSEHFVAAAALQQHLTARCLVAVVGRLGSGKSTVCLRAANSRWARQWFLQDEAGQPVHRRFWADLEDCRSGGETVGKIAHALGRPTFGEALARLGSGKPCLLILDNTDQAFAGDGETLAQLAACVPKGASIILTRRQVADLDVGRRWTDIIEVPGFGSHDEARQLFDHLAPRHSSDLRADEIVAACDRLPLAISVLARSAAQGGLEQARLRVGAGGPPGVEFALDAAAATFAPEDRHIWAALSEFPAGLSADDLAAVLSAVPNARERTIRLHLAGVVQRCPSGVRIPAPLRLPATAAGLHDVAIAELWRSYVLRAHSVVETDAGGSPGGDGASGEAQGGDRWLSLQLATLLRLASRHPLPEATAEVAHSGLLSHHSGVVADALDQVLVQLVEGSMEGADLAGLAQTAALLEDQRRFGASALLAGALVEAHRRRDDPAAESSVLCQLGRVERLSGRYDDAEAHLLQARARYGELDDGVGQGSALFELGQVALERGRLDDAESHLEAARSLFATNGRPVGEANANLDLVRVDLARGRLDQAERRLDDALDRYEQADHKLGAANTLLQMGQLELARGQLDAAERRLNAALDGYEQAADKVGFAHSCLQLGQVDLARGNLANAERRFGAARAGYERVGDQVGFAHASLQLGQIDLARGRLDDAATRLASARAGYERLGDRLGLAHASLQLGQVHLARGEMEEAELKLGAAQWTYDEMGDHLGSANSRQIEALFLQTQGRRAAAMATFAEAARLYASLGRTAAAGWSLAGAARNSTGRAECHGYAADAVRLLEEAGMAEAAAQVTKEFAAPPAQQAQAVPAVAAVAVAASAQATVEAAAAPAVADLPEVPPLLSAEEPVWPAVVPTEPAEVGPTEPLEAEEPEKLLAAEVGPTKPPVAEEPPLVAEPHPAELDALVPARTAPDVGAGPQEVVTAGLGLGAAMADAAERERGAGVGSAEPPSATFGPEVVAPALRIPSPMDLAAFMGAALAGAAVAPGALGTPAMEADPPPLALDPEPVESAEVSHPPPPALQLTAELEAQPVAVPELVTQSDVAAEAEPTWARQVALEWGPPDAEVGPPPARQDGSEWAPEPQPQAAPDLAPAPESQGGWGALLGAVELGPDPALADGGQRPLPEHTEPDWDASEAIDPRDLIRVAHGDPVPTAPGPAAARALPPEAEAQGDARRRSRFRFGRKKDRKKGGPDDAPMLPGFES